MSEGKMEFDKQLRELGFAVDEQPNDRISFTYIVGHGRFEGREVRLGFHVPPDFPRTPPSGPHISPRLLPLNPNAAAHPDRVHESDFGQDWEYLSRPYQAWTGKRTVAQYLAYIEKLLATS